MSDSSIECVTCGHVGDMSNKTPLHGVVWVCNRWQCITHPSTSMEQPALTKALQEAVVVE